jgi:hypothetical protein
VNIEELKLILEALSAAGEAGVTAFLVWTGLQIAESLLVGGSLVFAVCYVAKEIVSAMMLGTKLDHERRLLERQQSQADEQLEHIRTALNERKNRYVSRGDGWGIAKKAAEIIVESKL